jgi:large subunit ribosomal protein L25
MKTLQLEGTLRTEFGKKFAKSARKNAQVPCVLYGGSENIHFILSENDTRPLIITPEIHTVELNIDGKKYMSILKEAQFHPVKDNTMHIDFMEISEGKPIMMEVPVKLFGLAEGVKAGGKLSLELRKIKVKGLYQNIPDVLEVDVTSLGLGKTISVGSLSFENLEIITAKQAVVCAVKLTRVARGLAAAAAGKEPAKK